MKKLFSIICALCIMHCALAQTKCETIAEIKALESGTECVYEGYAITTYYPILPSCEGEKDWRTT